MSSSSGVRKLMAVAFADIVGYTRLSSEDEVAAMELVELLQALARAAVEEADGRVVKFLGDAVLLEFSSAEAAVEAGLRLSEGFQKEAESREREGVLRVGVHLGEATVASDGDVYGDVVNVASRVQTAASPGELLVSEDVWRQLHRRPAFEFGEGVDRSLKGLSEPLTTFPVRSRFQETPDEPADPTPAEDPGDRSRLAVLPFRILRSDPEIEFLEFSLPDAVACSLAGVPSLVVRSTASVMRYAGSSPDPREVGREAKVDLVLSGTVLRAAEQVRVAAQLADGSDGTLLWNETATVSMGDLFQLQDDLAHRIVESLAEPLGGSQPVSTPSRDRSHSGAGYELYLRANQVSVHEGDWPRGVELYRAALKEDPEYAPAWARLGRCHRLIGKYAGDPDAATESFVRAEEALHRALELNPDLALAHSYLAQLEVEEGRCIEGMARLLRRISRSGPAVDFFIGLTHACRYGGLLDASLRAHDAALALDPEAVTSVPFTHLLTGDYEEAIATSRPGAWSVAHAQIQLGRTEEAIRVIRGLRERSPGQGLRDYTDCLLAAAEGDRERAVASGWKAAEGFQDPEGRFHLATHWAALGAHDDAMALLERVVEGGFYCPAALKSLPDFDPLREAPEFGALLERAEAGRNAAEKAFQAERGSRLLDPGEA